MNIYLIASDPLPDSLYLKGYATNLSELVRLITQHYKEINTEVRNIKFNFTESLIRFEGSFNKGKWIADVVYLREIPLIK